MEIRNKYFTNRVSKLLILFVFFSVSNFYGNNFYFKDTSKTKYDINDPRNPHCPCHKYQKLADDEYRMLKEKKMKQQGLFARKDPEKNDEFNGKSFSNADKISKKHNTAFIKLWCKKKTAHFKQRNKGRGVRNWDIWKRLSDPTACYKF